MGLGHLLKPEFLNPQPLCFNPKLLQTLESIETPVLNDESPSPNPEQGLTDGTKLLCRIVHKSQNPEKDSYTTQDLLELLYSSRLLIEFNIPS